MVILRSNRNTNTSNTNLNAQANHNNPPHNAHNSSASSVSSLSAAQSSPDYSDSLSIQSQEQLSQPAKRQRLHRVESSNANRRSGRLSPQSDSEDFIADDSDLEHESSGESESEEMSLAQESSQSQSLAHSEIHSAHDSSDQSDSESSEDEDYDGNDDEAGEHAFIAAFANRLVDELDTPTLSKQKELERVYGKPLAKEIWGSVLDHVDKATDKIVREYLRMTKEVTALGKNEHMPSTDYLGLVCQAQKTLEKIQKMPNFSEKIRAYGQSEAQLSEQDYEHIRARFGDSTADQTRRITRLSARAAAAQANEQNNQPASQRRTLDIDLKELKSHIRALAFFDEVLAEAKESLLQATLKFQNGAEPIEGTIAQLVKLNGSLGFDDLIVPENVAEEIKKIVDFIANPETYQQNNIPMINGILFSGPPGTGKTHSARIIASLVNRAIQEKHGDQAPKDIAFLECNGADFTGPYIGSGVKMVNKVMQAAKNHSSDAMPSFLFIDEFDALAAKRGEDSSREDNKTLNAILGHLDGLIKDRHVVLIAATNHADKLDPAILRPGRIDLKLVLEKPDSTQRHKLLSLFANNYIPEHEKPDASVLEALTDPRYTHGYTGAEIRELTIKLMRDRLYQRNQGAEHAEKVSLEDYLNTMKLIKPSSTTPFPSSVKILNHTGEETQLLSLDHPLFDQADSQALKEFVTDFIHHDSNNPFQIKPPNKLYLQTNLTQKLTLAQAIAGTSQKPVIYADVRRMESKWIGESTKFMDNLLEAADNFHIKPAVLVLDNIDYLTASSSHAEVSEGMFSQLSNHLSRPEALGHLLVIGISHLPGEQTGPLADLFNRRLSLKKPDTQARQQLLDQEIAKETHLYQKIDTKALADKGQDFDSQTLLNWLNAAKKIASKRLTESNLLQSIDPHAIPEELKIKMADFMDSFVTIHGDQNRQHGYQSMYT